MKKKGHEERAHSKFSASGAERWFNCPGSVELSEGMPDKSSPWAIEGTQAHEVLEALMICELGGNDGADVESYLHIVKRKPNEMIAHAADASKFITELHYRTPDSECLVENKTYLDFIHPEMFGTYDGAVIEHFGKLHVFDYKYGAGHAVSPKENLQMIFYAIGLAHFYRWNFKQVLTWIIQPRIKGYDGPLFWEIPIGRLMDYVPKFEAAVKRVIQNPDEYVEGSWCHWCKAKSKCPLKTASKLEAAQSIFSINPFKKGVSHGHESKEENQNFKSETEWRKEASRKKGKDKSKSKIKEVDLDFF